MRYVNKMNLLVAAYNMCGIDITNEILTNMAVSLDMNVRINSGRSGEIFFDAFFSNDEVFSFKFAKIACL